MSHPTSTAVLPVHLVQVGRRGAFSSPTLPPAALAQLQAAFRAAPWYRDGWSHKPFRSAIDELRRAEGAGSVALIGPNTLTELPPPFAEQFEPIELGCWDPRLRLLSGAEPTRHERQLRWLAWILGVVGVAVLITLATWWFRSGSTRVVTILVGVIALVCAIVFLVSTLISLGGSWYLIPGGVAIVRRFGKTPDQRLIVCARLEYSAVIRMVNTGKSSYISLELWNRDAKRYQTAVSDREAISFLAAWQSPHETPDRSRLVELVV